jgi:tripartite-type tricarboxylate transporter receptor subunit TctC
LERLAPAGTPKDIVDGLGREVARAALDPKFVERLASFGVEPVGNTPEQFAIQIASDMRFWAEVVKIAGVQEQ